MTLTETILAGGLLVAVGACILRGRDTRVAQLVGVVTLAVALMVSGTRAGAESAPSTPTEAPALSEAGVRFVRAAVEIAARDGISVDEAAERLARWLTIVAEHAAATGKTFERAAQDVARHIANLTAAERRAESIELIRAAWPEQPDNAVKVAFCESTLDPDALNPATGDAGLFQINAVHRPWVESLGIAWASRRVAAVNVRIARALYDLRGWQPWYRSRPCHGLR
jgi:hypothetical protein